MFYDLVSAHSNPAILEIDKEVSLRMARHWNPIMMNAVLFGRIALLHENRATLGLTAEQNRLLEPSKRVHGDLGLAGLKYAMDWNGYYGGNPRLPLLPLTADQRQIVETVLADLRS